MDFFFEMRVKTQPGQGFAELPVSCARRRSQSAVQGQNFNATLPSVLLAVHPKEPEAESFPCALLPLHPLARAVPRAGGRSQGTEKWFLPRRSASRPGPGMRELLLCCYGWNMLMLFPISCPGDQGGRREAKNLAGPSAEAVRPRLSVRGVTLRSTKSPSLPMLRETRGAVHPLWWVTSPAAG